MVPETQRIDIERALYMSWGKFYGIHQVKFVLIKNEGQSIASNSVYMFSDLQLILVTNTCFFFTFL